MVLKELVLRRLWIVQRTTGGALTLLPAASPADPPVPLRVVDQQLRQRWPSGAGVDVIVRRLKDQKRLKDVIYDAIAKDFVDRGLATTKSSVFLSRSRIKWTPTGQVWRKAAEARIAGAGNGASAAGVERLGGLVLFLPVRQRAEIDRLLHSASPGMTAEESLRHLVEWDRSDEIAGDAEAILDDIQDGTFAEFGADIDHAFEHAVDTITVHDAHGADGHHDGGGGDPGW